MGLNVINTSKSVGYEVVTAPEVGVVVIPATTESVGYRVITSPVVGAAVMGSPATLKGTLGSTVG